MSRSRLAGELLRRVEEPEYEKQSYSTTYAVSEGRMSALVDEAVGVGAPIGLA